MIDSSKKRNCQLAFELQNSHVCEKRSTILVTCPYLGPCTPSNIYNNKLPGKKDQVTFD